MNWESINPSECLVAGTAQAFPSEHQPRWVTSHTENRRSRLWWCTRSRRHGIAGCVTSPFHLPITSIIECRHALAWWFPSLYATLVINMSSTGHRKAVGRLPTICSLLCGRSCLFLPVIAYTPLGKNCGMCSGPHSSIGKGCRGTSTRWSPCRHREKAGTCYAQKLRQQPQAGINRCGEW